MISHLQMDRFRTHMAQQKCESWMERPKYVDEKASGIGELSRPSKSGELSSASKVASIALIVAGKSLPGVEVIP